MSQSSHHRRRPVGLPSVQKNGGKGKRRRRGSSHSLPTARIVGVALAVALAVAAFIAIAEFRARRRAAEPEFQARPLAWEVPADVDSYVSTVRHPSKPDSSGGDSRAPASSQPASVSPATDAPPAPELASEPPPEEIEETVAADAPPTSAPAETPVVSRRIPKTGGRRWTVQPDPPRGRWNSGHGPMPQTLFTGISTPGVQFVRSEEPIALLEIPVGGGDYEYAAWDLITGKARGNKVHRTGAAHAPTISPDGTLLAVRRIPKQRPDPADSESPVIELWSLDSGRLTQVIQAGEPGATVAYAELPTADRLITFTYAGTDRQRAKHLRIWDARTGRLIREIAWNSQFDATRCTLSPGGRFLANIDGFRPAPLQFYDLESGELAGEAALPPQNARGEHFEWVDLDFSPDGREFAALRTSQAATELTVFDLATGDAVRSHRLPGQVFASVPSSGAYQGRMLEWLPDGSGWLLVGGLILDDVSGQAVWMLDPRSNTSPRRILGEEVCWVSKEKAGPAESRYTFQVQSIPWAEIRSALGRTDEAGAMFGPGAFVSVQLHVATADPEDGSATETALAEALSARLSDAGFRISEEEPLVFEVRYQESEGLMLQPRPQSPAPVGQAGGRMIKTTQIELETTWRSADGRTIYWKRTQEFQPTHLSPDAGPGTARAEALQLALRRIAALPIPRFLGVAGGGTLPLQAALP
ncbi:MAG: hypothetical protein KF774_17480 [Planctomyces sp.]|nr:hypothetical protein [Planctomyces sp.]